MALDAIAKKFGDDSSFWLYMIPFYNIIRFLEKTNQNKMLFFGLLIPYIGIIFFATIVSNIAKQLGKNEVLWFVLGLFGFPAVLLAFGNEKCIANSFLICKNCSTNNQADNLFCINCGKKLECDSLNHISSDEHFEKPNMSVQTCKYCNYHNKKDSNFCIKCGNKIEDKDLIKSIEKAGYTFLSKNILRKNGAWDDYKFVHDKVKIEIYDLNNTLQETIRL